VEKYGLAEHMRLGEAVATADFDEPRGRWTLRTAEGETLEAEALVAACGQLSRPVHPPLAGLERFEGRWFHSARWDHDLDLRGKRVAVIGTGASAIQFVPRIAPRAPPAEHHHRPHGYQRRRPWRG
jgi:cation diffusion facilitator CzcD-associated flavoprotein CzcO